MHLGMTGRFSHRPRQRRGSARFAHDASAMRRSTSISCSISATAPRSATPMRGASADGPDSGRAARQHALFKGLGIEPLEPRLHAGMARRAAQGQGHLDQGGAARSEADRRARQHLCLRGAVRAGISPLSSRARSPRNPASRPRRPKRLVAAIKAVLEDAIKAGGSSLRDYQPRRRQARRAFSTASRSTTARASPAQEKAAEEPYAASSREDARPSIVQPVNARGLEPHVCECLHRQGARTRGTEKDTAPMRRSSSRPRARSGSSRSTARMR